VNYHDIEISDEVIAAIDADRKIEAIKILRERTGIGLADAKHLVDRLARERQAQSSTVPAMTEEGGAGVMIRMVAVIAVILGVYFYFY
jgi:ribosomal protein L7/L12